MASAWELRAVFRACSVESIGLGANVSGQSLLSTVAVDLSDRRSRFTLRQPRLPGLFVAVLIGDGLPRLPVRIVLLVRHWLILASSCCERVRW